jgi:alanine racemase
MIQKSNSIVTVNLSALKQNVETLSCFLDEETRIMAVVKANAYGHGAVKVAETLDPLVEAFAVNDIHEGIELREHGINKPILVFCVPEKSFASQYRMHNLTATISAKEQFEILPNGSSYHLNFDTGMSRLGFHPEEAEQVAQMVHQKNKLFCTGIYTHFATADNPGSELVHRQHQQFKEILQRFPEKLSVHISNTGGLAFYEAEQFNMVRLGIGLYGYPPGETEIENLKPVMSWKSNLVQVREIKAQKSVSYGARWVAPENGYLGVIPVGYDDGLRRNLSGKISVRIGSEIYNVVGTITMNYSMVFLHGDQYQTETEVELLYPGSDALLWAKKLGTIPYEILTGINDRIPRKYIL